MKKKTTPFVSFIIPTYNANDYIEQCLKSIINQDYPKNKYEILVVDGRSKDRTREIAKSYGAIIIDNPQKDPETAKSLGIQKSKGEIIALVDSDNIIVKKDWLINMVDPLIKDPSLYGVESFYFPQKGESIFNTYCMVAHIADPFSRCLAARLEEKNKDGYIEYMIPGGSTYPLGANGFLWNKRVIKDVGWYKPKFEESNFSYLALQKGYRKFARVAGYGIYHNHITSLSDFIAKRIKIGNKFLKRKEEKRKTWLEGVPKTKFIFSLVYCLTFIGPFIEGLYNLTKTGERAWLLHPFMSFISVVSYGVVFIRRKIDIF